MKTRIDREANFKVIARRTHSDFREVERIAKGGYPKQENTGKRKGG